MKSSDAFEMTMKGRIAENSVLSHDLLEGSYARCALVTDVEFVQFPVGRARVPPSREAPLIAGAAVSVRCGCRS